MFIGRSQELHSLQELYEQPGFGMTVIYGRRRIGKSTLIAEFIKNKRAVFYTAAKVGQSRNLELFSQQVLAVLAPELEGISFPSLENVFDFITRQLVGDKLILVIDELPFWAEKDEALLSVLQKYIDTRWLDKSLMIILCGSSLSFMENKVLSEKSPLFGRRNAQIRLNAFTYKEAALFVPDYSYEEKAVCYGITGGVAKYLALIDPVRSLDENIRRLFFRPDGYLYDEPRNLLTQEFSDVTLVNNIIEQIASGSNTANAISLGVHESIPAVLYPLEKLMAIDLVEKKTCITEEKNRKKTQYVLKDHMFKFWYFFIPKAASVIEIGQGGSYYDRVVKSRLHDFMGSVFEDMCRSYTLETGVRCDYGSFITQVGTWWGTERLADADGRYQQQSADIDVVGISEIDRTAVIGECKFKNEKIDKGIYETLLRRAALITGRYQVTTYLFFSLGGYTDWFKNLADDRVVLLKLKDMYE